MAGYRIRPAMFRVSSTIQRMSMGAFDWLVRRYLRERGLRTRWRAAGSLGPHRARRLLASAWDGRAFDCTTRRRERERREYLRTDPGLQRDGWRDVGLLEWQWCLRAIHGVRGWPAVVHVAHERDAGHGARGYGRRLR